MARSSLLGIDPAPTEAPGRAADRLGPGDSSDSGSDVAGLEDDEADPGVPVDVAMRDDQVAPLPLGETTAASDDGDAGIRDGADIGVDRVFTTDPNEADLDDEDPDAGLSLVDEASLNPSDEDEDEDEAEGLDETAEARPRKTGRASKTRKAGSASTARSDDDAEALPGEVDPAERRPGRD